MCGLTVLWLKKKLLKEVISKWRVERLVGVGQAKGRREWTEVQFKDGTY